MITLTKFNCFVEHLAEGIHDLGTDTLKLALTDTAPVATDTTWNIAAHPDPTNVNGYTSGGVSVTVSTSSQSSGTYSLVVANTTFTASGGSLGPFRYLILYNNSAANAAIGWFDNGSSSTLLDTEVAAVNFDQSNGVIQIV